MGKACFLLENKLYLRLKERDRARDRKYHCK